MTFEIKPADELPNDPANKGGTGRQSEYPFTSLEIGEGFLVPASHHGASLDKQGRPRIQNVASRSGRYHGKKFKTRRQKNGDVVVTRIK